MSISEIGSSLASFFSSAWSKIKSAFSIRRSAKYTEVSQSSQQWIDSEGRITDVGLRQAQPDSHTDPELELNDTLGSSETKSPFH
ncbi:MAG: hypothetical protein VX737_04450 [Pseudomonadota bacterium]|nr:hypothetical protein [Pseudomonadota bacterium]